MEKHKKAGEHRGKHRETVDDQTQARYSQESKVVMKHLRWSILHDISHQSNFLASDIKNLPLDEQGRVGP